MIRKLFLPFMMCIIFFSCNQENEDILILLSNSPEVIPLAEFYNSRQEDKKIMVYYEPYITLDELDQYNADMIIARDINNTQYRAKLQEMNWNKQELDTLYSSLIFRDENSTALKLLPLSFDIPVMLYKDKNFTDEELPFMIDSATIETLSSIEIEEAGFTHIPFSPLWNPSYLRYLLHLQGEDFNKQGDFAYDSSRMSSFLEQQSTWLEANIDSAGDAFSEKYRYIPDIRLLQQERIDFVCSSLVEYLSLQESIRQDLQFSYLSLYGRIRPNNTVFAGINSSNKKQKEAIMTIYTEILSSDFQKEYMNWKKSLKIDYFGFLNGFSSNKEINQLFLPEYYRELESRVFQEEQLLPVLETPSYWSAICGPVVEIWLKEYLNGIQATSLEDFYKEWDLQFIP